ncbi:MAG: hypothetical protein WA801_07410, partial [Pseudolabrys sp.]
EELCLRARPMEMAVIVPHVVWETFTRPVVALAVLSEADHPQCAFVYALVYSAALQFYSKDK